MINQNLYLQAGASARALSAAGLALAPRPNSPMSQLLAHCENVTFEERKTNALPEVFVNPNPTKDFLTFQERAMYVEMATSPYGLNLHGKAVSEISDALKPIVLSHVSTARNVVMPLVSEFNDAFTTFLNAARNHDPASDFMIEEAILPEFISDVSFVSMGFTYNPEHRISDFSLGFSFQPVTENEDYAQFVSTGNSRVDQMIQAWISTLPDHAVKNIFETNFSMTNLSHEATYAYTLSAYTAQRRNPFDELMVSMICYLIAKNLLDEPRETNNKVSSDTYGSSLKKYMDFCGTIATQQINRVKTSLLGNIVVVEGDLAKKRLVVNRDIYRDYLSKGGKPEALLGILVTSQFIYAQSALLDASETLTRSWNSYISTARYENEIKLRTLAVEFIHSKVFKDVSEPTEFEAEYFKQSPNTIATITSKVNAEIEHLGHRLLQDTLHTSLHIIAKARFFYTGSYDILNEMMMIEADNPDIDPREAVNLSAMKYIVRYLLSQVISVKAGKV